MIRGVLLDLSGVVYEGSEAIPGALRAVLRLRDAGLRLRFVTNTTRTAKPAILKRLEGLGLAIEETELFTPAEAACAWLRRHNCSAHLLVHPNLLSDFAALEPGEGRAVVVGDAGEAFDYQSLNRAFRELVDGAEFLALAKNRAFKDSDGRLSMDAGAFVAALEYASGREAIVLGKPAPGFYAASLASMACEAGDAVMVGDDAEADVAGALQAGIGAAVLVRTGKYRPGDESRFHPPPSATLADLSEAADWIVARQDQ